jgi:hypothetical protein
VISAVEPGENSEGAITTLSFEISDIGRYAIEAMLATSCVNAPEDLILADTVGRMGSKMEGIILPHTVFTRTPDALPGREVVRHFNWAWTGSRRQRNRYHHRLGGWRI